MLIVEKNIIDLLNKYNLTYESDELIIRNI